MIRIDIDNTDALRKIKEVEDAHRAMSQRARHQSAAEIDAAVERALKQLTNAARAG